METNGKMCVKRIDLPLVSDRKKVEAVASLPKLTDTHED